MLVKDSKYYDCTIIDEEVDGIRKGLHQSASDSMVEGRELKRILLDLEKQAVNLVEKPFTKTRFSLLVEDSGILQVLPG